MWYDGEGYDPTDDWWIFNGAYGGGAAPVGTYVGSKFVQDMHNQDQKIFEKIARFFDEIGMWFENLLKNFRDFLTPEITISVQDNSNNNTSNENASDFGGSVVNGINTGNKLYSSGAWGGGFGDRFFGGMFDEFGYISLE